MDATAAQQRHQQVDLSSARDDETERSTQHARALPGMRGVRQEPAARRTCSASDTPRVSGVLTLSMTARRLGPFGAGSAVGSKCQACTAALSARRRAAPATLAACTWAIAPPQQRRPWQPSKQARRRRVCTRSRSRRRCAQQHQHVTAHSTRHTAHSTRAARTCDADEEASERRHEQAESKAERREVCIDEEIDGPGAGKHRQPRQHRHRLLAPGGVV